MGWMGEFEHIRARVFRGLIAASCGLTFVLPDAALAEPAAVSAPDLKAVELGFAAGMEAFNSGDYQTALKTWNAAVALLPETPEHRPNRIALYEMMVKAYQKELERVSADADAYEAIARDAMTTLDGYAQGFSAAYPGEPLPPPIAETREQARGIVKSAEEARKPELPPPPPPKKEAPPPPPPPTKPWKPFAIGGGVALGAGAAMLAVFGAGFSRAKNAESAFDDPANACDLDDIQGMCADIDKQGKSGNKLAAAGLITAPLLLGAGVALLVVAARRKSAGNRNLAPVWSPTMAGVVFEQRF